VAGVGDGSLESAESAFHGLTITDVDLDVDIDGGGRAGAGAYGEEIDKKKRGGVQRQDNGFENTAHPIK